MAMFTTGHIIASQAGNEYELLDVLGEGVTAEVYRARRKTVTNGGLPGDLVALKVLRQGLTVKIEENFRDEVDTLGRLRGAAAERNPRVADFVPLTIEDASHKALAETRFIAFEYVTAPSIDKLLSDDKPLDERSALTITSQVLSILDVLHTDLRKSYTDFQLQNIRWDAAGQQVKVIDWNHLSREAAKGELPAGAVDDLARMGAYLYQMVTGAGARLSGESLRMLEQRGRHHWTALSLGLRLIIARALHLNPQRRYQTAAEFRQAVDDHLALWVKETSDLKLDVLFAVRPISAISSEGGRGDPQTIERAQILVDLLRQREPEAHEIERGQAILSHVVGEISPAWAAGFQDYQRGAYQQAAATWQEEAQAMGRVALQRWVMLAQTAAALGLPIYDTPAVRPVLERALEAMIEGDWEPAIEALRGVAGRHRVESLDALLAEAKAWAASEQARAAEAAGNWTEASRAYKDLLTHLPKITYAAMVRDEFGWDEADIRTAEARSANNAGADASAQDQRRQVEAALARKFDDGLQLLIQELQKQPDNPGLIGLADKAAALPPVEALRWLDAILTWAGPRPEEAQRLRGQWQTAHDRRLNELAADAVSRRDIHSVTTYLRDLRDAPPDSLRQDLDQWYGGALRSDVLPVAAALAGVLGRWDAPHEAQKRETELARLRDRVATDGEQWQATLLARVQSLREKGHFSEALGVIDLAAAYYADDADLQTRLNTLRPETEVARLLAEARDQINGAPDKVGLASARDALARAEVLLPGLDDPDGQARQRNELDALRGQTDRAEARLTGERYLSSAEEWLRRDLPRFSAAEADYAEADKRLADLGDPELRKRLQALRRQLDSRVELEHNHMFRYWLAKAEEALAQSNPRAAGPMADLAAGYRHSISRTLPGLEPYDRRLEELNKRLAEVNTKEGPPDPTGGAPVIVVLPPPSLLDTVLKWLPLALSLLGVALLIALLAGVGRAPAAIRALPTSVVELQSDVRAANQAVGSLAATMDQLAAAPVEPTPAPTPAPTLEPTRAIPPTATIAPTTTASPTPMPLDMNAEMTSLPLPLAAATFFDLPNMRLTAPAGWQFDRTQPALQLIDDAGDAWLLSYNLVAGTDPAGGQDIPLDRQLAGAADGNAISVIDLNWTNLGTSAPQPAGSYTLTFKATHTETREQRLSPGNLFTVQTPPRVTLTANGRLRSRPEWDPSVYAAATFAAGQEFELLGMRSAPCTTEGCNWPEADTANMLLVRPVGQRQTYWVGDHDTTQFNNDEWAGWTSALPLIP